MILALETSQRSASVALRDAGGRVHEEPLTPRKRHDDDLMPAIDRMFRRTGLGPDALRGGVVAVSIGPGGFTGLRIAVATAKMLAETLDARLVAVPSAIVAAEGTESVAHLDRVLVALACKADSFWLTRLVRDASDGAWRIDGDAGIATAGRVDLAGASVLLADEFFPDSARKLAESHGVQVLQPEFRASACLRAGELMLARGLTTDALNLLPLYPRQPEAVSLWERRHASGS